MPIGSVYQVEVVQTYGSGGEETRNVFFYHGVSGAPSAEDLAGLNTEDTDFLTLLNAFQADVMKNKLIRITSLFDVTDFFEDGLSGTGANATEPLPIHNAINFTLKVNTRAVRPGKKRIAGIDETSQFAGVINNGSRITALNNLATWMAEDLVGQDGVSIYEPIVVKRIKYTIDEGLPSEHFSYRLPVDLSELVFGRVTVALVNLRVSHQVSRGNGR